MNVKYCLPRKELRGIVSRFWHGEVDLIEGEGVYRIIASGNTGIIIQLFQNRSVLYNKENQKALPKSFIYGQKSDSPCLNYFAHKATVLGVDLHPTAFKKIFGFHTTELTNTLADAEDLLPSEVCRQLYESTSTQEAIKILENHFLRYAITSSNQEIEYIIQKLNKTCELANTTSLAEEVNMSRRSFQRKFKEVVGIDAYTYSRIMRFQKALHFMQNSEATSLTQVAYKVGYADQSHFGREFRVFVGDSPKAFLQNSHFMDTPQIDISIPFRIIGVE